MALGFYALTRFREGNVPNDLPMNLAKTAVSSLLRAEAFLRYPHRSESKRIIMFYRELDDPRRDLEAMERHLARLEAKFGRPMRAKVFWVRGPNLLMASGPPGIVLAGISLSAIASGSDRSPADWDSVGGNLDRHELAHAAIDEYCARDSDPPRMLKEGWAESQSGPGATELARHALNYHERNPSLRLTDMATYNMYYHGGAFVYPLGGAFTDFLIRRFGMQRFLRIYNEATRATFHAKCREIFSMDLEALEGAFWKDATELVVQDAKR